MAADITPTPTRLTNVSEQMTHIEELADAIRAGQRTSVSRAITLVESRRDDHRSQARVLLNNLVSHPDSRVGKAVRVGISGVRQIDVRRSVGHAPDED